MIQTKRMRNDKAIERSLEITRKRSQWADIASRLSRSKVGMFGFSIVVILLILVIFAPLFTRHDPALQDLTNKFAPPSSEHLMGTDNFGRDLWSRLLYGGRISLLIAFFSTLLSCICGLTIGSISGYFGGKLDIIINRILDVMMATVLDGVDVVRRMVEVLIAELPYVTLLLRVRGNTATERWALERRREFDRRVAELLKAAAADGDVREDIEVRLVTRLVFGMINSIVEWYKPEGQYAPADLAAITPEMVFTGIVRSRS